MNIFLSYASPYHAIADDLCCRLQAVGHAVFFDREDLPAGESFDDHIRRAIDACELFVFLVSPEAVADGHYTRTELKIVSRKWPTPGWHVLPVMVADTPLDTIPPYLRALTLMQAEGNLAAEVVFEVETRVRKSGAAPVVVEAPATPALQGACYRSLQLRFDRADADGYALGVPESPAGAHAPQRCTLTPAALEQTLWADAVPIAGSTRRATPEFAARLPSAAAARAVGEALHAALFDSPLGGCLAESLRAIDPQRGEGLRFVINTTAAPDLARLPWEFLYSPAQDDFLFSDRMKPVVRWLDVDAPPPTLTVEPPLRLLVAVAAPADRADLQVGEEIAHLDRALDALAEAGTIETSRLDHASLERLDNALLEIRPHVLHFIGHGDFVGDEGVLVLESDTTPGTADTIAGRQLAVLLRNHLGSLRLVFLNSCMGATASARDPFGGVAQSLIRRGMPAVIAMQFPVPDAAAVALAKHFYRYLAAGQPVDAALTSARAFLYARGYAVEWGAPALHMRTPDGRLFDLAAPRHAPAPIDNAAAAPSPDSAPPPVTNTPRRKGRAGLWAALALGVALAAGATLWWLFAGSPPPHGAAPSPTGGAEPPTQTPEPPPAPVIVAPQPPPAPDPAPSPSPAPMPSPRAVVDQALADLRAGDTFSAARILSELRQQTPAALSAEALGTRQPELADALATQATQAFDNGEVALALSLADHFKAVAPDDTRLAGTVLGSLFGDGVPQGAAIEPAAGDDGERMTYVVRRGDTLWAIAQRLLGNGERWRELRDKHNAALSAWPKRGIAIPDNAVPIEDPDRLIPGQRLIVPLSPSTGTNAIDYHVAPGESLSRIAQRVYGDARLWRQIQRDNADRVSDPNRIRPGQVLVIRPARR